MVHTVLDADHVWPLAGHQPSVSRPSIIAQTCVAVTPQSMKRAKRWGEHFWHLEHSVVVIPDS
eukprot:1652129-Amphidinium_carterae.1